MTTALVVFALGLLLVTVVGTFYIYRKTETNFCKEDWKTCGHCKVGFDTICGAYPKCDKVSLIEFMSGGDICSNAPMSDEYNNLKEDEDYKLENIHEVRCK